MLYNKPEGEVKGINTVNAEMVAKYGNGDYRPDVFGLFWSFRIMVGVGCLMLLTVLALGVIAFFFSDRIRDFSCYFKMLPLLLPLPFIANSVGWYITEAGRQPWIVVGLQKTVEAVSPNISSSDVWITLIGFTAIYLALAIAAIVAAVKFINRTKITEEAE
jgi:cytochrome d ubiquinol oxidase subunit I